MLGVLNNKTFKKSFQIVKNHLCFTSRQIIVVDQIHNRKIKNTKMTIAFCAMIKREQQGWEQQGQGLRINGTRFNEMGSLPLCDEDALPSICAKTYFKLLHFYKSFSFDPLK